MANAIRDENRVTAILGTDSISGNPIRITANPVTGALKTEVTGAGSGGTSSTDGDVFAANGSAGTAAMGVYQSTPSAVTDGDLAVVGITANRELKVSVTSGSTSGTQYADGAARATATGNLMMVDDGTLIQSAAGTSAGVLKVDISATTANATAIKVDGSAATQPVSGTVTANIGTVGTLSTAANQTTGNTSLSSIDSKITAVNTGAVVISSSALPTGAATSALQSTGNTSLSTIAGAVAGTEMQVDVLTLPAIPTGTNTIGSVKLTDGTLTASVRDTGTSDSLNVAIVDASGNQVTSFGGGTQYADSAVRGTATGTLAMGDDGTNIQSIKVDSSGVMAIQDNGGTITVDGTVSVTGVATAANQSTEITALQLLDDVVATDGAAALTKLYQVGGTDGTNAQILSTNSTGHLNIADGGNSITVDNGGTFAVQAAQSGTWTLGANSGVDIGDVTINNASGASAVNIQDGGNSITIDGTVTANAGTGTFTTKDVRSATGTLSNVSGSATNVTLLASNANRLGATIFNDSTAILYVKLAATASTTSFTIKLYQDDYFEVPYGYTGIIDGIWASATGSARVTELT